MLKIYFINNFLSKKHFKKLTAGINLTDKSKNSVKVYQNTIYKNKIVNSCIDKKTLKEIHSTYHNKLMNILKKISYDKSKIYDYSEISIVKTGKDTKFPIHDDTPDKLLSGVVYLSPNINTGTVFHHKKKYAKKKKLKDINIKKGVLKLSLNDYCDKEIKWRKNFALLFSRLERQTWHSYGGDGINDRVVLVYNLKTKNFKKVFEIEKKNYYLGMLRFKLNPYLYKHFKFTI